MAFAAPLMPFMAIAGTAIQGIGEFQQSRYQAAVAKNNAKIAEQNAKRADYASQIEQFRSDREIMAENATLLATQAASGLDVLGRSQMAARRNLARVGREQALDIRQQGMYNALNYMQESANYLGEARALKTAGWMGLASTAFDVGMQVSKLPKKPKPSASLIGGTG